QIRNSRHVRLSSPTLRHGLLFSPRRSPSNHRIAVGSFLEN
ncbi:unnamed protein product, partial [Brassica rapa subsp. trilocularis]